MIPGFLPPEDAPKSMETVLREIQAQSHIAAHHLILSHAAAVQRYREKYQVSTFAHSLLNDCKAMYVFRLVEGIMEDSMCFSGCRRNRRGELGFCLILCGMSHLQGESWITMLLKEHVTFILDGNLSFLSLQLRASKLATHVNSFNKWVNFVSFKNSLDLSKLIDNMF